MSIKSIRQFLGSVSSNFLNRLPSSNPSSKTQSFEPRFFINSSPNRSTKDNSDHQAVFSMVTVKSEKPIFSLATRLKMGALVGVGAFLFKKVMDSRAEQNEKIAQERAALVTDCKTARDQALKHLEMCYNRKQEKISEIWPGSERTGAEYRHDRDTVVYGILSRELQRKYERESSKVYEACDKNCLKIYDDSAYRGDDHCLLDAWNLLGFEATYFRESSRHPFREQNIPS